MHRYFVIPVAVALAAVTMVIGQSISNVNAEISPSSSPSPSTSAEPTPAPVSVSPAVRSACLDVRHRAVLARRPLVRIRKCFLKGPPERVALAPARHATEAVWLAHKAKWRHQTHSFRVKFTYLHNKMVSTTGGGALRWRPLIRWTWPGWSEGQVYLMSHVIWHESSGSPYRWNRGGSGAFGLFQLLPKPSWVWKVMSQAKAAYMKWKGSGYSLSPWAGCVAFSCSGGCGIY